MRTLSSQLHELLKHLALHKGELSFDTAMVLGGGAFRHYFFTPDDNHAWLSEYPDDLWREDTLWVENYGLFEAIEGHTGWASRRWVGLTGAELVQLLRYEQDGARFVRQEASEAHPEGIIRSFEVSRDGISLNIERPDGNVTLTHSDLSTIDDFAATLGALQTLRPPTQGIPPTRRHALTADVLRWAPRHWQARKEILFDVQAFYAAGDRAWSKLYDFARTLQALDTQKQDAALTYIRTHLAELAIARASAANFFSDPAAVVEHTGRQITATPALEELAAAWRASADAAYAASESPSENLVDAIAHAHAVDTVAFEQLDVWAQ